MANDIQSFTSFNLENDAAFKAAISKALRTVRDLRTEFGLIAKNWRKGNRAQFSLKGNGKYEPLNPAYKARKTKLAGRSLPMLVGAKKAGGVSGRLRDSMIDNGTTDSILQITRSYLAVGTKVPHGVYHQSDRPRTKIPQRKFLFITETNVKVWTQILENATKRKLGEI